MNTDRIQTTLQQRFQNDSLWPHPHRRLIFWYDADRQFQETFNEIDIPNVAKLTSGDTPFTTKYHLPIEAPQQNFLLYAPFPEPDPQANWLLDLQKSGLSFSADRAALLHADLGWKERQLETTIRQHLKFFDRKKRTEAYAFIDQWMRDREDVAAWQKLSEQIGAELDIFPKIESLSPDSLQDAATFEDIDRAIVRQCVTELKAGAGNLKRWHTIIQKRRPLVWFAEYQTTYDALAAAIDLVELQRKYTLGFRQPTDRIFTAYTTDLYQFDLAYRHFIVASDKAKPILREQKLIEEIENIDGKTLELIPGGNVLRYTLNTQGAPARAQVLKKNSNVEATVLSAADLLKMIIEEGREAIKPYRSIYIYHDAIDTIGDKAASERLVLDACDRAIEELVKLVKRLCNALNATNVLITADRGFLYQRQPISEADKLPLPKAEDVLETNRRFILRTQQSV